MNEKFPSLFAAEMIGRCQRQFVLHLEQSPAIAMLLP